MKTPVDFSVGQSVSGVRILEVIPGPFFRDYKYRIKCETCGEEYTISRAAVFKRLADNNERCKKCGKSPPPQPRRTEPSQTIWVNGQPWTKLTKLGRLYEHEQALGPRGPMGNRSARADRSGE